MLKTIRLGDSDVLVKVAQYLTGFAAIREANEDFEQDFFAHVMDWQEEHDLIADGIIGKNTWTEIKANAPTCSTSKNKESAATCAVQLLVGGLDVDGKYGPKTKKAVAAYQSAHKLKADGVCGPKTWNELILVDDTAAAPTSSVSTDTPAPVIIRTGSKVLNECVHYLQWDKRWKNIKYSTHTSSQTIGNSGCGPSSMAQIMATFIDKKITPVEMCELAYQNGYRTYNSGTAWGFFPFVFKHYDGFGKYIETSSVETLKGALGQGALAVCSMNSNDNGYWTSGGHFITAIGYDADGYIYANDPNKSAAPRKQLQNKFQSCMKQAFIFWPKNFQNVDPEKTENKVAGGSKIIDISKWQGNIDFDALKKDVALVIVRASCGSDKDVKFDEYAQAMNERNIPFGVYCYSYAGDNAKAIDEAKKLVSYASKYNPLFYVMDAEEERLTHETILTFSEELRRQGAKKIGCYCAHHRYKAYNYADLRDDYDFTWIPRYGSNDGTVESATKPAYTCDLWQYTSRGTVAGISGNVDINILTGDGHDLAWFLKK